MTTRSTGVLVALLAALLTLAAAPAYAQQPSPIIQRLLIDTRGDGVINACKYTPSELAQARREVPPDIEQYASYFPAALELAIEQHARGECGNKAPATPVATSTAVPAVPSAPPAVGVPTKTIVPKPPGPEENVQLASTQRPTSVEQADAVARVAAAAPSNDPPAPVWLLFVVAGALAAAGLFVLVAGRTRRGQESLAGLRHSWGEAAWRAGGTWGDFRDFLRFGR